MHKLIFIFKIDFIRYFNEKINTYQQQNLSRSCIIKIIDIDSHMLCRRSLPLQLILNIAFVELINVVDGTVSPIAN